MLGGIYYKNTYSNSILGVHINVSAQDLCIELINLLHHVLQNQILGILLVIDNVRYWLKALEIIVIDILKA